MDSSSIQRGCLNPIRFFQKKNEKGFENTKYRSSLISSLFVKFNTGFVKRRKRRIFWSNFFLKKNRGSNFPTRWLRHRKPAGRRVGLSSSFSVWFYLWLREIKILKKEVCLFEMIMLNRLGAYIPLLTGSVHLWTGPGLNRTGLLPKPTGSPLFRPNWFLFVYFFAPAHHT